MKFLIVDDDSEIRALFSIVLKKLLKNISISEAIHANQAIDLLKSTHFDFIITDFEMPGGNGDLLVNHLQASSFKGYLLLQSSILLEHLPIDSAVFNGQDNWSYLNKPLTAKSMQDYFEQIIQQKSNRFDENQEIYARIRILHFLRFNKALTDIYIKLNDDNFVKVINKGDYYRKSDIDKYIQKKQKYLYISHNEFDHFLDRFRLTNFLELCDNFTDEEAQEKLHTIHFVIKELVSSVGVSPEAFELTNQYANEIEKITNSDQAIKNLLFKLRNKDSFEYEHSFMTACLATYLLNQLDWTTREHIRKVCMASLFHDIFLDFPVAELDSRLVAGKSSEKILKYKSHPYKALEVLQKNIDIPSEVLNIIEMHHEKPDGSGFPKGVGSDHFKPLCCVFILAHEFICELYQKDFDETSHKDILVKLFNTYNAGSFKGILDALHKTLLLNEYFNPDE